MPDSATIVLAVMPPLEARSGKLDVLVEQQSTRREAVVEFGLDVRAAGTALLGG